MTSKRRSPVSIANEKENKLRKSDIKNISSLSDALLYLTQEIHLKRNIQTRKPFLKSIEILKGTSLTTGLATEDILNVVNVITSSRFNDVVNAKLVSCLLPAVVVPLEAVQRVISHLCFQKTSLNLKVKLLEWVIAIFDFIHLKESLHQFYDVIFHFTKSSMLCPHACHLIFLITQKEDVRPLWIRRLKSVELLMGLQPEILGLLSLYQLYRPDLVTLPANSVNKKYFKKGIIWTERLERLRRREVNPKDTFLDATDSRQISVIDNIRNDLVHSSKNCKSSESSVLPSVRFVNSGEDFQNTIQFHQINTFQEMVDNIHRIQLPSRIISLLKYRAMRMVLLNKNYGAIVSRLNGWIESNMLKEFVFHKRVDRHDYREELLDVFIEFSEDIQEGIPCIEDVLSQYLISWNGFEHRAKILTLISRWRICPHDQLQATILEPLRKLFFRCSLFFKCSVIECLTQMVHYVAMIELARYSCADLHHKSEDDEKKFEIYFRSIFPSVIHEQMDVLETFSYLIEFVVILCDAGLKVHEYNSLLFHQVLSFYEELSQLYSSFGIPKLILMSRSVVYNGLFSLDPTILSRICTLLASNKYTLEYIQDDNNYMKGQLGTFSKDFVSTLWKNESFKLDNDSLVYNKNAGAQFYKLSKAAHHSAFAFSLAKHPAFVNYSRKFLNVTSSKDVEAVIQLTENRKKLFTHLKQQGYHGLFEFWNSFISKT